ncbi:MAG: IclR family transcriptional regulator, partial [Anaerolineae bacterium]
LPPQSSGIQSVERAIAILKSFSMEQPERGVSELSQALDLHKSTVSRLVQTLERGGLLTRNPETRRYQLGTELIGLGAQVTSHLDVREVARPLLRQLAMQCQESVNLVVLVSSIPLDPDAGSEVVNLEQFIPPARQVKNIGRVGRRMCAHSTAAGKVLLAYLPPEQQAHNLPSTLMRFTARTITQPDELQEELGRVRQRGYAVSQEELEEGLNALAAPIRDHTGAVIAAASVAGPAYRVTPEIFHELAQQLMHVTAQISEQLGYRQR